MKVDLTKPEIPLDDASGSAVKVASNALRSRIRELISEFMMKPKPVSPTDADIMNSYLERNIFEFNQVNHRIIDLEEELENAAKKSQRRLKGQIEALHARRREIIAETASNKDFLSFRSEKKALFNEDLSRYEEQAIVIQELKPFLGMPHLPDIETKSLTAEVILSVLSGLTQKAPTKGQMVLMLDEAIYSKPQFFPRSALRDGIASSLRAGRGGGAVRVPFSANDRLGAEALGHGAYERLGRVYFKLEKGKPQAHSLWNEIDRYLPFSSRSISVPMLPLVTPSASGFDFKTVFGEESWKPIKEEVLDKHSHTCMVCGGIEKVDVIPRWRFREPVFGTFGPGVQQLESFMTMCESCKDTLRPELSSLLKKSESGYVLNVSEEREAWLRTINRWNDPAHKQFANDAYLLAIEAHRRRARTSWIIDLSLQRSAFFMLERGFYIEHNGWIWPKKGSTFKIVGAAFFESENQTRNFFQKPSIFDVPWGSDIAAVSRILDNFQMAAVDERGAGVDTSRNLSPVPDFAPELIESLDEVANKKIETVDVEAGKRPTEESSDEDDDEAIEFVPPPTVAQTESNNTPSPPVPKIVDEDDEYDDEDDDYSSSSPDYHEKYASSSGEDETGFDQ